MIWAVSLKSEGPKQKDGAERARRFCSGGVHAVRETDEGTLALGGPRRHVTIDLEAKRAAIAKAEPVTKSTRLPRWRTDKDLLTWLESL
jgi:hypothetical protein